MRNGQLCILIFVFSGKLIFAQNTSIGMGYGWDVLLFDRGHTLGLHVNLSVIHSFNEFFEIDLRPGVAFASNFSGFGFGFGTYLKVIPLEIPIYLIGGVKFHSNIGSSGNGTGVRDDLYYLPTLGVGYKMKIQKTFISCEMLYQKPYPNGLTWFYSLDRYYYADNFNAFISFNFSFSWEI